MRRALTTALALALAGLTGCAARPTPNAPSLNESTGAAYDAAYSLFTPRYDDATLARYVREVGDRIATRAGKRISFIVTNEGGVEANALPGGTVRVSRGALVALGSEAELAALLGHEVAHIALGHSRESLWVRLHDVDTAHACWTERSLDEQLQADQRGISLLAAAGYDPRAAPRMLGRVYAVESAGESDRIEARVRLAHMAKAIAGTNAEGATAAELYLDHLDGVVFGKDTRDGVLVGRTITSERDGFAMDLPNEKPLESALPTLSMDLGDTKLVVLAIHTTIEERLFDRFFGELTAGLHETRRLGDVSVVTGHMDIKGRNGPVMVLTARGSVWIATAQGADEEGILRALAASVRPARDAPRAPPPERVRIRRTNARARFAEAVRGVCRGDRAPRELATWNGYALEDEIPAGARIKCVER